MSYNLGLVATLAELEAFYKGQHVGDMIELMNMTDDILDDIPWMESNQSDGHKTRIRTGLPEVYWRRLYQGTPPSKSEWTQVKEHCGILEAVAELDVEEVNLYGDKANAFRLSEGKAFTEAMRQKVASTLFYGDSNSNPDEFNGLAMRYPASTSPNVVNAGGTSSDVCTSIFGICWGSDTAHGLYPKGSTGGLNHDDLGLQMTADSAGRKFQCYMDRYNWRCGLAVRDWRSVVRICNIKVANLTKRKGETGFIDLQKLTIEAKNLMPETMRNKMIWYCGRSVMTALELQASDSGNVTLHYGELWNSKSVPFIHGRPVRQCDSILETESVI